MSSFIKKSWLLSAFFVFIVAANSASAAFTFEKTATPASPNGQTEVEIQDSILYTITIDDIYRNEAAEIFTIQDEVPDDLDVDLTTLQLWTENFDENNQIVRRDRSSDILANSSFCTVNDSDFECTIPECGAGNPIPCIFEPTKIEFIFEGVVNENILDNEPNENGDLEVCNTATVNEPNTQIDQEATVCHILKQDTPNLEIKKTAFPDTSIELEMGQSIEYYLEAFNWSDQSLENVIIQDQIEENLNLMSYPENCIWEEETQIISCMIPTLAAQSAESITLEVQVRQTNPEQVCNQAFLTYDEIEYPSQEICHTIKAGLSISKNAIPMHNALVRPNEPITYEITVHNPTADAITNQIVKDELPSTLVVDTEMLPSECAYNEASQMLFCEVSVESESYKTISIVTVVQDNSLDRICNEAELVLDDTTSVLSFPVCHDIGNDLWSVEKTAIPPHGSTVAQAEIIDYTIVVENTEEGIAESLVITDILDDKVDLIESSLPEECTYKQDIHTVTCTFIYSEGDLTATQINIPLQVQVRDNTEGSIQNTAILTYIQRPLLPFIESNTVVHEIEAPLQPSINITKSATPTTDVILKGSDAITYTITIENSGDITATDITVNDILPTIIQDPDQTKMPANCEVASGIVTCDFDSLSAGASEVITLETRLYPEITSGTYCNDASVAYQLNGEDIPVTTSNEVCHQAQGQTTGGGGGGGAVTTPTIGTCSSGPRGSGWTCVPRYPVSPRSTHEDPFYNQYKDCIDSGTDISECLIEWADASGFSICGPTNIGYTGFDSYMNFNEWLKANPSIDVPYTGSSNADQWGKSYNSLFGFESRETIINHQCSVPQTIEIDGSGSGDLDIANCEEGLINVNLDNITKQITTGNIISRGDNVTYQITIKPEINENTSNITNVEATLIVYDYTVPNTSEGQLYHRDGIRENLENGSYQGWTLGGSIQNGIKFTKEFTNLSELTQEHTIRYVMDSELAIENDVAKLENTAFARLLLTYDYTTGEETISETVCAEATDPDSEGSNTTVNVIRPFLEAQGGANIGGLKTQEGEHKLFGDVETIRQEVQVSVDTAPLPETATQQSTLLPFDKEELDQYEQNANETAEFFEQTWNTTPDQSGIYFYEGDITLPGTFDAQGQSKTFVLNSGNLIINKNFKVTNGFVAFIVRGAGNIVINPNVSSIEGVFITEDGQIISQNDTISKTKLIISGGLIGDAKNLIGNRRFIGDSPSSKLEPSMTVIFDLRLLDQTPPGLQGFLGGNWEQTIE